MFSKLSIAKKLIFLKRFKERAGGVIKTLSGTLPLSFTALASNIISLIQYGKTEQNGTPTPSAPVNIVCNNGALQMVDDELPNGYKRLLGISFDGNFHYETGEYLTGDDDVTMTLENPSSSGTNVFGSYNGGASKVNFSFYIIRSSSSGSYFRFGDQLKRPVYGGTEQRTITFGKSGTSGFMVDVSVNPDDFTTQANVYIGMLPNSSSPAYSGDIIGSILVSNRLEWIPCENPGGVIGYYEKYNGNFIAPTGSGTPVSLGYDGSHLSLGVIGTPEVLKVGGKNLIKMPTFDEVTHSIQVVNYWNIPIKLAPNTTYYMSSHYLNDYTSKDKTIYVLVTADATANTDYATIAHKSVGIRDRDLTTGDSGYLYLRVNGGVTRELYEEMLANTEAQLELGSTATSYEPYREPQTASVQNLYQVGDYKDEQDIISGTITRRVGVKVLDGTENWGAKNAKTGQIITRVTDMLNQSSAPLIVTHGEWSTSATKDSNKWRVVVGPYLAAFPSQETTADFKDWLAAQYAAGTPVIVMYPLAEEETETVTPQPLKTVQGNNTISAISDISGIKVDITYLGEE